MSLKENVTENFSHSEKLQNYIQQTIKKSKIQLSSLSAVAVSKGQ